MITSLSMLFLAFVGVSPFDTSCSSSARLDGTTVVLCSGRRVSWTDGKTTRLFHVDGNISVVDHSTGKIDILKRW